jgi:hypothetical protein
MPVVVEVGFGDKVCVGVGVGVEVFVGVGVGVEVFVGVGVGVGGALPWQANSGRTTNQVMVEPDEPGAPVTSTNIT